MTIYVVQSGEYSDRGICGIFSTSELAQKWIDENDKSADIKEFEVDERDGERMVESYECIIDYHTGRVISETSYQAAVKQNGQYLHIDAQYRGYVWGCNDACIGRSIESPEHAMKLAVEKRQAELRKITEILDEANLSIPWSKK